MASDGDRDRDPRWPDGAPRLAVFSKTIGALPLRGFLPELAPVRRLPKPLLLAPFPTGAARLARVDAVAGWGVGRPHAERIRRFARREGAGYVALEDGFLRSVRPGAAEVPASLVADPVGVYYDATRPSLLERLLEEGGWESGDLLDRARRGVRTMRRLRLSKYNLGGEPPRGWGALAEPYVLVVDQRRGDMSVALGGGASDAARADRVFADMAEAAGRENPGARVIVKIHPDEASGAHVGHLAGWARERGVSVVDDPVNPWALIERAAAVYVVSSLMGFEALMAGRRVRCFGRPFYAGWGATVDERTSPRRTRRRSATEIFAAAYLLYARYVDVETGRPIPFEAAATALAERRDRALGSAG